jgi:hypothetical protein
MPLAQNIRELEIRIKEINISKTIDGVWSEYKV